MPKGHQQSDGGVGRKKKREREREREPGALSLLGYKDGVPRALEVLYEQIKNKITDIRAWEGKSGVTQAVSYLSHPGLSKRRS